jgi:hypothetical protein
MAFERTIKISKSESRFIQWNVIREANANTSKLGVAQRCRIHRPAMHPKRLQPTTTRGHPIPAALASGFNPDDHARRWSGGTKKPRMPRALRKVPKKRSCKP